MREFTQKCQRSQFLSHVVFHAQGENFAVETVQDGRDVQFAIRTLNLGNVGQQLLEGPVSAEILLYEIFRLHRRRICFRQPLRTLFSLVQPAMLPHETCHLPNAGTDSSLGQRQSHPLYPVVVVAWMLVQYPFHLNRKKLVPRKLVLIFDPAIIA